MQEEVRRQAELVWYMINVVDGWIFVCGAGKGMGEGVGRASVDVAVEMGGLNEEEAEAFWSAKREGGPVYCCKWFFSLWDGSDWLLMTLQETWCLRKLPTVYRA